MMNPYEVAENIVYECETDEAMALMISDEGICRIAVEGIVSNPSGRFISEVIEELIAQEKRR